MRLWATVGLALCVALPGWSAGGERQPGPWVQLKLEPLGFPGFSGPFLENGASMLTVNFLDDSHLLLTYSMRKLVPRVQHDPNDPDAAEHEDREVAAEVVELPSGKVQARTEWHLHDHARYLWPLGAGSFLVRIGDKLSTISPMARLSTKEPFLRTSFPARPLGPAAVFVSPDGGLVTLETVVKTALRAGQTTVLLGDDAAGPIDSAGTKTMIDFFRLKRDGGDVEATAAGTIQAGAPVPMPVDADGLLWATPADTGVWSLTFDPFGGKTMSLGKLDSSCSPRLQMTASSEFVALTCRGSDDRIKLASFGLDGKETWEESIGEASGVAFAYAPDAARFALSRTVAATVPIQAGQAGTPAHQEVRVYQNASGDMLLHVDCSPVIKSAENFDLSSDGSMAVVVRNGGLSVYKLAPLSQRDHDDIAAVEKFAPPRVTEGKVTLGRLTTPVKRSTVVMSQASAPAVTVNSLSNPITAVAPVRRKPPTLLNPGEKPDFGAANEQPKSPPE